MDENLKPTAQKMSSDRQTATTETGAGSTEPN